VSALQEMPKYRPRPRQYRGKCFVTKDNIDTDQIIPAEFLTLVPSKVRPRLLLHGLSILAEPWRWHQADEYEQLGSHALCGLPDGLYEKRFGKRGAASHVMRGSLTEATVDGTPLCSDARGAQDRVPDRHRRPELRLRIIEGGASRAYTFGPVACWPRHDYGQNRGERDKFISPAVGCVQHAPIAMGAAGARVVVAQSYARIFFRNSIATGEVRDSTDEDSPRRVEVMRNRAIRAALPVRVQRAPLRRLPDRR
jgi:hypothetical protein